MSKEDDAGRLFRNKKISLKDNSVSLDADEALIGFCGDHSSSQCRRISLRRFLCMHQLEPFERLDGTGMVEMQHRIELTRKRGQEIVALALRLRSVDDANGP